MGSEWTECMITPDEPLLSGNLTYPPNDHAIRYEINYVGIVPPTLQGFRR